ncbi:MAG: FkbM family methyltransferase [Alphaproteobacteria bacterium]|nr:MAG: FkbM family methyltransferase [Alphaproteobacteria bacterium]
MRIGIIRKSVQGQRRIPSRAVIGAEGLPARQIEPYRWRLSGSAIAHLFKATTRQHHRALASTITRLVPPAAVVFDVGAHAGQYTKLFARAAAQGRVYAVEPGSYARSILRTVVWLRRLGNVAVLPMALGAVTGLDTLTLPVKGRGSFGFGLAHLGAAEDRWHKVAQELVALTTLDAVVAALGLDRVDFIKADIEGWELRLLHGSADTLRRFRPRLMLELTEEHLARAGDRLDDAFAFLNGLDYAALEFAPGRGLIPVATHHDGDFWFIPCEDSAA